MKIVIAPDSFKGSLSATAVADSIACGIRKVLPESELILIPIADGGEGTAETLIRATGGRLIDVTVMAPLGDKTVARLGIFEDNSTAVVEMASASGLTLVPSDKRNPMNTTSYGTGELIRSALDHGCKRIILAIGGSATNDGGIGALQALGVKFFDRDNNPVGYFGKDLLEISKIDISEIDSRLPQCEILVACDVDNPLTGPNGATMIFGPQKGADHEIMKCLDAGLHNLAEVIKNDIGIDIEFAPGAGAAGGLGGAALAVLGGKLVPGIDLVLNAVNFKDIISDASLIITGEGKVDKQTLSGKAVSGIIKIAKISKIPVLVIAGSIEKEGLNITKGEKVTVFSIAPGPISYDECKKDAANLLESAIEQLIKLFVYKNNFN